MRGVLVDVDGTLLRGASSERLFIGHLLRTGRLGSRQVAAAMLFGLRYWPEYGRQTRKKNKAYLAGLLVSEVQQAAEAFVRDRLLPQMREALVERLLGHRRAGDRVALLTGTPDFIAHPLGQAVGAVAVRATRCATRDGVFLSAPPLEHPFGEGKLRSAVTVCAELGVPLSSCVAYADSVYDVPLLERVGQPVAVHPDDRLRQAATRRGWEVLDA